MVDFNRCETFSDKWVYLFIHIHDIHKLAFQSCW